jgi:phage baseplate assembly protein gpV
VRARKTANVAQMAQALSYPGIDPRRWCDQGLAVSDPVTEASGTYIEVRLNSGGVQTCRVVQMWGGVGCGAHVPIEKDDQVALLIPGGNVRAGVLALGALSNGVDVVDEDTVANPQDYRFTFKAGRKVVLKSIGNVATLTFDDGSIVLVNSDGATVSLDAANHRLRMQKGTTTVDLTDAGITITSTATTISGTLSTGAITAPAATFAGNPVATKGMPIALNADWLTWLTALAAAATFTTPPPASPIGLTGV